MISEMLAAVDLPMLVQTVNNRWNKLKVKNLRRVTGIGPEGWAKTASEILKSSNQGK
jgi:mannose/fructose-specific phosphotransferase system component IIA